MYRSAKYCVVQLICMLGTTAPILVMAQNYAQQEQIAKDAKNQSIYRVERAQARIDETVDWIRSNAKENVDAILSAQFSCINSSKKSNSFEIQNVFKPIDEEIKKTREEMKLQRHSFDRKIEVLKNSYKRICDEKSSKDLDSYLNCVNSTEKLHTALGIGSSFEMLEKIQNLYVTEQIKKLKECYLNRGVLENEGLIKAAEALEKTNFLVRDYGKKLNDATDVLMGLR
jgi:hypothetical protein